MIGLLPVGQVDARVGAGLHDGLRLRTGQLAEGLSVGGPALIGRSGEEGLQRGRLLDLDPVSGQARPGLDLQVVQAGQVLGRGRLPTVGTALGRPRRSSCTWDVMEALDERGDEARPTAA